MPADFWALFRRVWCAVLPVFSLFAHDVRTIFKNRSTVIISRLSFSLALRVDQHLCLLGPLREHRKSSRRHRQQGRGHSLQRQRS